MNRRGVVVDIWGKGMNSMKKKLMITIVILLVLNGFTCLASEAETEVEIQVEDQIEIETETEVESQAMIVEFLIKVFNVDDSASEEEAIDQVEELLSAVEQIITSTIQEDVNSVVEARAEVQEYDLEGAVIERIVEAKEETLESLDTDSIDMCIALSGLSTSDFNMENLYTLVYADDVTYDTLYSEFIGTWTEEKIVGGIAIGGTERGLNKLELYIKALMDGTATLTVYNELDYEESEYGQLRAKLSSASEALIEEIQELYESSEVIIEFLGIDEYVQEIKNTYDERE